MRQFIRKKMRMTHIYQPLMLKILLKSGDGTATTEQIARSFLNKDNSQLQYYKNIVKRWPHKTLKKHNIVSYKKGTYTILLDRDITERQRQSLVEMCDLRLNEFMDKDPWITKFRDLDTRSISGSIRYDILSKSKGVCVACGIKSTEALLDIDHIIPISMGGMTEPDNLQALCPKCNRGKRNRDEMDFLRWHKRLEFRNPNCKLCKKSPEFLANKLAYSIPKYNDTSTLVVPNRHVESFMELSHPEKQLCISLVDRVIEKLQHGTHHEKFYVSGFDGIQQDHCKISIWPITS